MHWVAARLGRHRWREDKGHLEEDRRHSLAEAGSLEMLSMGMAAMTAKSVGDIHREAVEGWVRCSTEDPSEVDHSDRVCRRR